MVHSKQGWPLNWVSTGCVFATLCLVPWRTSPRKYLYGRPCGKIIRKSSVFVPLNCSVSQNSFSSKNVLVSKRVIPKENTSLVCWTPQLNSQTGYVSQNLVTRGNGCSIYFQDVGQPRCGTEIKYPMQSVLIALRLHFLSVDGFGAVRLEDPDFDLAEDALVFKLLPSTPILFEKPVGC